VVLVLVLVHPGVLGSLGVFVLVFCSSVTGDTPRRCIHQKFTLTSLSSLLFYLFHLLFRLKTLDRSIDFLALPFIILSGVFCLHLCVCVCVCVLTWWPVGQPLLDPLFGHAPAVYARCFLTVFVVFPLFFHLIFSLIFRLLFLLILVVGRIVDTLLTTFLDEFVGFLIPLPLALDSVHCSTLSDITHTPRWPPSSASRFRFASFSAARFISVYSVVFVFNLAGCIDFAVAASFL